MTTLLLLFSLFFTACSSVGVTDPERPAVPASWTGVDIGSVGVKGETQVDGTEENVTVLGAGEDIWSTFDSFHMATESMDGDGSIVTYVREVQEVDAWTKAGVMMRSELTPGSQNVYIHVTPRSGAVMQVRSTDGAETLEPGYDHSLQPPIWLKLERSGAQFVGSYSKDGTTWTVLGRATVAMPSTVHVGLAVTSKDPSTAAKARFEESRIRRGGSKQEPSDPPTSGPTEPGSPPSEPTEPVAPTEPTEPGTPTEPTGERTTATYAVDPSVIPNPERGWYFERTSGEYASSAAQGYRLALRYVNLSSYRNTPTLPSSVFDELQQDLDRARSAGLKIIIRFAYNRSRDADAPLDIVLGHIAQAGKFITENADVIAVVQAGFIGAWGEWHSSTNNLLTVANHTRVSNALLDAIPESRMIQLRKPQYLRELFPSEPATGTTRAFDGSDPSRVGLMNDCFLTTDSDSGTFLTQSDYLMFANVGAFTAIGGETCDLAGLVPRNDCPTALAELDKYHWDYLNHDFWASIVDRWEANGCYDEISARLGYRYELSDSSIPTDLVRGASVGLEMTVRNTGFGKLYNPRPLEVLLVNAGSGQVTTLQVTDDARAVMPLGGETRTLKLDATVPSDLATGSYFVYLRLPDAAQSLRSDPRYSVRFANTGVWDSDLGANDLDLWVNVR